MRRGTQAGSALAEVLVALVIVSLSLVAFFHVAAERARRIRHLETTQSAFLVAQSKLAAAGVEFRLDRGPVTGEEGPFAWRVDAELADVSAASAAGQLWRVTVGVRRRDGGPAVLLVRSLRLAPAA